MKILNHKKIYKSVSNKWKKSILDKAIKKIIANFYSNEKIEITHDYDPPYDSSGQVIHTNNKYKVEDYRLFSDFLEEYNGVSEATFISGCGLYWQTYKGEIEQILREENYDNCRQIIAKELNTDIDSELVQDYYDEYDNEIHDDFVFLVEYDLIDLLEEMKEDSFKNILSKYIDDTETKPIKYLDVANNMNFKK